MNHQSGLSSRRAVRILLPAKDKLRLQDSIFWYTLSLIELPNGVVKERLQLLHLGFAEGHPILKAHVALIEGLVARLLGIACFHVLVEELFRLFTPGWKDLEAGVAGPHVVGILLLWIALLPFLSKQIASHADHLLLVQEVQRQRAGVLVRDVVHLSGSIVSPGQVVATELPSIHDGIIQHHLSMVKFPSTGKLGLLVEVNWK